MTTKYIALANISLKDNTILKGELITQETYNILPDKIKNKFKIAGVREPVGRNEIIGDSDQEKEKREQLAREFKDKPVTRSSSNPDTKGDRLNIRRRRKGI